MAQNTTIASTEILNAENLQIALGNTLFSFTEVGGILNKKPSVIAQYAKAGVIHPIQQGSKKVISLKEIKLLEACMHAVKHYGCSYTACKILKELLQKSCSNLEYLDFLKKLELKANITENEVIKYVNSYQNRGIFQKNKNKK